MVESKIVSTPGAGQTMGDVTERITDRSVAQKMVLKYANNLLSKERSQQFFAQVALMYRNNPALANCDPQSIFSAMMACVHLDLMPNTPEGYAYIIPYGKEAQFQLGYKGLLELAMRSGVIKSVNCELVFPEDTFRVELGTDRKLVHNPSFEVDDRGDYDKSIAVYATAVLSNGTVAFDVLTKKQVEKIRKTAKSGNSGPWGTWADQMAKKTVLKRLLKLLPSSSEDNRFKVALEIDSRGEAGKPIGVDTKTGQFIDGEVVSDVRASEDKKASILAANGVNKPEATEPEPEATKPEPVADEVVHEASPPKPAEPKVDLKAKGKKWAADHVAANKQPELVPEQDDADTEEK